MDASTPPTRTGTAPTGADTERGVERGHVDLADAGGIMLTAAGTTGVLPYEETLCNESWRPSRGEEESLTSTPPPSPRGYDGASWAVMVERICSEGGCTRCGLGRASPRATPLPEGFEPTRLADADFPRLSFPFRELWNGAEAHSLGVGRICCGLTQSSYQCLRCGAETVAASHPAETGAARPPTPLAGPSEDHLLEHPAGDAPPSPSAPPSPPEPTTPARSSSATPPSPATPRAPCTRAHGREYSSDEDGGGPYGTEAGDVNYADAAGAAAGRVTDERLHIAATTYPRGSLDGALPSPPVGLENLPTEVIGATIMPMLGLRRSRELDFYGAMEPQEMATYYYTGGGRPLLVITSSRLASE
mmetsp:Transcript_15857/g.51194  ORF Transcript_15857/g.51194 Transcript_15857/m.51194 type:complete len:361 (+) Transcript_15857:830-1912(+)